MRIAVFVSATSIDLKSGRAAAAKALSTQTILPVIQENFPANYVELRESLRQKIANCDAVICIAGKVFGAAPAGGPTPPRSYTQLEYDISRELEKPVFVFLASDDFISDGEANEPGELTQLQLRHRAALLDSHHCAVFSNTQELQLKVTEVVPELLRLAGLRSMLYLHPPAPPSYFAGRRVELDQLKQALRRKSPSTVAVLGMGGQGKTTLVRQALQEIDGFHFAAGFWCTAYRGGFLFDNFLDEILKYLTKDKFDKRQFPKIQARANELIIRLQRQPVLVVIDGIEHWLRGSSDAANDAAALSIEQRKGDTPGLDEFLGSVAGIVNGTHLILTSRAFPAALDHVDCAVIPVHDPGQHLGLEGLDDVDALELLRRLGVRGPDDVMIRVANTYSNHPLALEVLAGVLVNNDGGRIEKAPEVHLLDPKRRLFQLFDLSRKRLPGRAQAERVMQVAASFLEDPSLPTLRAVLASLAQRWPRQLLRRVLRRGHDNAFSIDSLQEVVVNLSQWNLLNWDGANKIVQLHPLVKEFFRTATTDRRRIHRVLADYYARQKTSDRPETLEHAKSRTLAIEHSLRSDDAQRGAQLIFAPFTPRYTFIEWLSAWGHQVTAENLLRRAADATTGILRGDLLTALGAICRELGALQLAKAYLDEAVAIGRKSSWLRPTAALKLLAGALHNRGNVYRQLKDFDAARRDFDDSSNAFEKIASRQPASRRHLANAIANRGNIYFDIGNLTEAVRDYDRSIAAYEHADGHDETLSQYTLVRLNRAIALTDQMKYKSAVQAFDDVIDRLHRAINDGKAELESQLAYARVMKGSSLNDAGRHGEALAEVDLGIPALSRLVDGGRRDLEDMLGRSWMDRAEINVDLAAYPQALEDSNRAVAIVSRLIQAGRADLEGTLAYALVGRSEATVPVDGAGAAEGDRNRGFESMRRLVENGQVDIRPSLCRKLVSCVANLIEHDADPATALQLLEEWLDFAEVEVRCSAPQEAAVIEIRRSLTRLGSLKSPLLATSHRGRLKNLQIAIQQLYNDA
jgi:tetratricopeptide (TPR) repeat protein